MKSPAEVSLSGSFENATGTPTEVGFYWMLLESGMSMDLIAQALSLTEDERQMLM